MQKLLLQISCFILLTVLPSATIGQHIPLFSQYIFNGLVINPAYAKGEDGLSMTGYYKKQWRGSISGPSTYSATIHNTTNREQHNTGLIFYHDDVELRSQNDISLSYAHRINTGKGKLGLGLSGGVSFLNFNKYIDPRDPDDEVLQNLNGVIVYPKLGMGMHYHTKDFFAGISIPQWIINNNNKTPASFLKRAIVLNSGYKMHLSETFGVHPSFLLKYIAGSPFQIDYTLMLNYKKFLNTGIAYRTYTSFILICQITWNRYTLGYAYDLPDAKISAYSSGSHEFMLRYNIRYGLLLPDTRRF
jgi:type IX secretion system PorP/SprF family membrane protein